MQEIFRLNLTKQMRVEEGLIAQELLEPHLGEFTCAIFKYGGHVRTLAMRRWLMGGITSRIIVEQNEAIEELLQRVATNLPERAAINVQLRLTEKGPRVFEINPRLSSTVMMRHKIGFSDLLWWVNSHNGVAPPEFVPSVLSRVYRTFDELVVLADTDEQSAHEEHSSIVSC